MLLSTPKIIHEIINKQSPFLYIYIYASEYNIIRLKTDMHQHYIGTKQL